MGVNYYYCDEPTVISFSGGRTSAYMLYKTLEAHNGVLPDFVKVCFANTGKEMMQTLEFVEECSLTWNVPIVWLEYTKKKNYKVTDYNHASFNGEPFEQLITDKKYLPNGVARFCTSELKVLTIERYMKDCGYDEFQTMVGIRADEPRRVVKMRNKKDYLVPLANDNVTKLDIYNFWNKQSFDLQLPNERGVNHMGNCDLCFLKGTKIKLSILAEFPEKADWWIEQEKRIGATFGKDSPSYERMQIIATDQQGFDFGGDETLPCFCGD